MSLILLQKNLTQKQIKELLQEFPHFKIISLDSNVSSNQDEALWNRVEIFFGDTLSTKQLEMAQQLKWVHSTNLDLYEFPIAEIQKREDILISNSKGSCITQIGEFVLGVILGFSKRLFSWNHWPNEGSHLDPQTLRSSMWTLEGKTLLQIGLGQVGNEIARHAKNFGLKVWGVRSRRSFHPHCHKTFPKENLHSLLPVADIISLALPRGQPYKDFFGAHQLSLMKKDAVLIVLSSSDIVEEKALVSCLESGKLRGVLLDTPFVNNRLKQLALEMHPKLLLTPHVASFPQVHEDYAYRTFRFNLRQYSGENFHEMKNLLQTISNVSTSDKL